MQPQQHQNKSPRTRSKQIQAVATPISKKAAEYAGPTFHHSPAPANLPPPPFLARSISQQKDSLANSTSDSAPSSLPVESSPLSFLFSAMQKEESLHRHRSESPPVLGFQTSSANNSTRSNHTVPAPSGLFNKEGEDVPLPALGKDTNGSGAAHHQASEIAAAPKKSPWAPLEKPRAVSIPEQESSQRQQEDLFAKTADVPVPSNRRSVGDKSRLFNAKDVKAGSTSRSTTNTAKTGRSSTDTPRKRKTSKNTTSTSQTTTPQSASKITPKKILKREVVEPQSEQRQTEPTTVIPRESASSTFVPLKKTRAPAPQKTTSKRETESEDDLRQQAAHLMSILHLPTPSPRDNSPARSSYITTTTTTTSTSNAQTNDPSMIESDLRRLLKLGA